MTSFTEISFDSDQLADVDVDSLTCPVDDVMAMLSTDGSASDGSMTYRRASVEGATDAAASSEVDGLPYIRGRGWKMGNQTLAVATDSHKLYRTILFDASMLGPNLDQVDWDLDALGDLSFDDFDFSVLNPVKSGEQVSVIHGSMLVPLFTGLQATSGEDVQNLWAFIVSAVPGAATASSVDLSYYRQRALSLQDALHAVEEVTAYLKTWVWSPYDLKDASTRWTRYSRPTQDLYEATK